MKFLFAIILSIIFLCNSFSQTNPEITQAFSILESRGEVVIKFTRPENITIEQLTQMVSIDRLKKDTVWAYLNQKEFENFIKLNISFKGIEPLVTFHSLKSGGSPWNWDTYPTYIQYLAMMDSFPRAYPALCKKIEIGKSIKGKSILFIRINPDTTKPKPSVMYSSTMHGDETGGFVLMLRFIDYLLKNYDTSNIVTKLVDSLDIWINPLASPDGTYHNDTNIWLATYNNANNVNLNRNFPDPFLGPHPYGAIYQPETKAMMSLLGNHHFVLSANFHEGNEVVNYPWDHTKNRHADDLWFQYISHEYADSAQHYGRTGYFADVTSSGITEGAVWYTVYGGRQDYATYFCGGREVTIELDRSKLTPENQLNNLWNYNYRSFLHYIEQAMFGIHGFVLDSASNQPVKARVELLNHDSSYSVVYSDSLKGDYYRLINEGIYSVQFSAPGYNTITVQNINVHNRQTTYLNVYLGKNNKDEIDFEKAEPLVLFPNPCSDFLKIKLTNVQFADIELLNPTGQSIVTYKNFNINNSLDISGVQGGYYYIKIHNPKTAFIKPLVIRR
jgi:hypothetical protein